MSLDNVTNDSIPTEAVEPQTMSDAADAILGNWEDAAKLSENEQEAEEETTDETEVEESDETEDETEDLESDEDDEDPAEDEDPEDEDDEAAEVEEVELDDDSLVEILIDGETQQASVKDLKRLYGQEASLTRKSQEMAAQRKLADEKIQKTDASLQALISRAQERYKPYAEVDMLVASKQMNADDFTALRAEAKQAEDDLKFLTEEADQFYGYVKAQQAEAQKEQAKECLKVLQREIPDWDNALYNDIRGYAISQGLPEESVNQYADPNVIMLLNKARMFDQNRKVATVKKKKSAQKVLRSKKAPPNNAELKRQSKQKQVDKLRANGNDLDNIASVLMANWEL